MGHRANLLLVESSGYKLFYCHWCATTIPHDIFWGPEWAIPYIQQQHEETNDRWQNEVFAEGGVLVDLTRQHLLLWGGEDINLQIPLRRLYLALLREIWQGWTVEWAYRGVVDLAEYVGIPRERVLTEHEFSLRKSQSLALNPPKEPKWTNIVGSIILEDGSLRLLPLPIGYLDKYLLAGQALVDAARQQPGQDSLDLTERDYSISSGFHIDLPQKQVAFWANGCISEPDRIAAVWPGWQVIWLKDNYEEHLTRTRGRLMLPAFSDEKLLADLEQIFLRQSSGKVLDFLLKMADERRQQGHDVWVNPYALRLDPQTTPEVLRRTIFDRAVAAWCQRQSSTGS